MLLLHFVSLNEPQITSYLLSSVLLLGAQILEKRGSPTAADFNTPLLQTRCSLKYLTDRVDCAELWWKCSSSFPFSVLKALILTKQAVKNSLWTQWRWSCLGKLLNISKSSCWGGKSKDIWGINGARTGLCALQADGWRAELISWPIIYCPSRSVVSGN